MVIRGWARLGTLREAEAALTLDRYIVVAYVLAGAFASLWGGKRLLGSYPAARHAAAAGFVVAGLMNIVEDRGLEEMLSGAYGFWPLGTTALAWPRLFILGAVTSYAVFASAYRAWTAITGTLLRHSLRRPSWWSPSLVAQTPPGTLIEGKELEEEFVDKPAWRKDEWRATPGRIGICCSGGGIRSAAFNLGALQALGESGILGRADYLAAVSGGAYIAAALSGVERETPRKQRETFYPPDGIRAFALRSPEESYLRRNTSYMAPSGWIKLLLALRLVGGVLINVVFGLLVLFVVTRPLGWILRVPNVHHELLLGHIGRFVVEPQLWLAVLWPAALGALIGGIAITRRWKREARYRAILIVAATCLVLSITMFVALIFLPWVGVMVPRFYRWLFDIRPAVDALTPNYVWLANLLGVSALAAAVVRIATRESARIAQAVALLLFPLLLIVSSGLMVVAASRAGLRGPLLLFEKDLGSQWIWWLGAVIVLLLFYGYSDLTMWSMHPFYKRRLCRAFSLRRKDRNHAEAVPYDLLQEFSRYDQRAPCMDTPEAHVCDTAAPHTCGAPDCPHECRRSPEIVICAAASRSEVGAAPAGRGAVSFTFGPREVGGKEIGWIATAKLEKILGPLRSKDVTMPAAVAISGAAISPAMGKMTRPSLRALLTILNARLGVWLPNPRYITEMGEANRALAEGGSPKLLEMQDRPRVSYLVKEMLGWHRMNDKFVYVTDGGHYENLGLVELLRRGCTDILCFDAAGDAADTFFTLGEAIALARTELGITINIDPTPVRTTDPREGKHRGQPWAKASHVVGTITYPPTGDADPVSGQLVYSKAVVTLNRPWDVKAFGEKNKEFPTLGTFHQLYREEMFEAYRALGHSAAETATEAMAPEDDLKVDGRAEDLPRLIAALVRRMWLRSRS